MQQGRGVAGVTPAGERVPGLGGEAGLRPHAVTLRGPGRPWVRVKREGFGLPSGQEGGPRAPLHVVVKHPPGEGSPRSPPSPARYRHQCGTHTPPRCGCQYGIPAWCRTLSQYRCQQETPVPVPDPHPSLGFSLLVQVLTWHPPPRIKTQFQYGCWCGTPTQCRILYQAPILVLGSHPSMGARRESPSQYSALNPVQVPTQGPPFQYRMPHSCTGSPYQYRCWNGTSHPSMGHPILVLGPDPHTGTGMRSPSPVQDVPTQLQVLGRDFPSQYVCWDRSLVPVPGPHPGIDTVMGPPISVWDTPCRYRVPIPVWVPLWDLHPSMGAGTSPSCR